MLNRSRCAAIRLGQRVLQELAAPRGEALQPALLSTLAPLASHSVSVAELKLLFGLLAQRPADRHPLHHTELLGALSRMLRQAGPAAYFVCDGRASAVDVPPVPLGASAGPSTAGCASRASRRPPTRPRPTPTTRRGRRASGSATTRRAR